MRQVRFRYKTLEELRRDYPNVAFPKDVRVPLEPQRKAARGIKKALGAAKNADSVRLTKALLHEWGKRVRDRDHNTCQWCGDFGNQPHHIVPRSVCSRPGWFDLENGVTLCVKCHIFRLKSDPDEYIAWRDEWLKCRKLDYWEMKSKFLSRGKMSKDDMTVLLSSWRAEKKGPEDGAGVHGKEK
jgi:hypothetical protein